MNQLSHTDITEELTASQFMELKDLADEPSDKDTMSEDEFIQATQRWRTTL